MKVKLSYSVQTEEIKDFAFESLTKAARSLKNQVDILTSMANSFSDGDSTTPSTSAVVDSVRQSLSQVDQHLLELHGILQSLSSIEEAKALVEQQLIQQARAAQQAPPTAPAPQADQILQKTQSLQRAMANVADLEAAMSAEEGSE